MSVGTAGLGQPAVAPDLQPPVIDVAPGQEPRIAPAIQRKRKARALHKGKRPYEMTWGPPVKYVEIPGGEAGTIETLKIMKDLVLGPWGHRNPEVAMLAQQIVSDLPSKDYKAEAQALFDFMREHVRYRLDPAGLEYVSTPWHTLLVSGNEDCFTHGTRVLLKEGMRAVPVESLRVGDEIWGLSRWSKVVRTWDKGVLPTWRIHLNNGGVMRLTPDHHVFVAKCQRHNEADSKRPCSCRMERRELVRIKVEELRPGMVVPNPTEIPYGSGEMDPDRAYVEGLYLSDGFSTHRTDFAISGKDGFPKEAQKRRVEEICKARGIRTTWSQRYITVLDEGWAYRMRSMGGYAWEKRAPSINLIKESADRLLEGIMADSGRNTKGNGSLFTSTSFELWLQTRLLLKMQGLECSSWFVQDHGGLGTHPIWRLGIRDQNRSDGSKPKLLRIKEVVQDDLALPCCDIETDDHYVWLPEVDWTVSQCDGHAVAIAALAMSLGHRAAFRTVKGDPNRPEQWSHVYGVIGVTQNGQTEWLTADSTQKEAFLGWDPPEAKLFGMKTWVITPGLEEIEWDS